MNFEFNDKTRFRPFVINAEYENERIFNYYQIPISFIVGITQNDWNNILTNQNERLIKIQVLYRTFSAIDFLETVPFTNLILWRKIEDPQERSPFLAIVK